MAFGFPSGYQKLLWPSVWFLASVALVVSWFLFHRTASIILLFSSFCGTEPRPLSECRVPQSIHLPQNYSKAPRREILGNNALPNADILRQRPDRAAVLMYTSTHGVHRCCTGPNIARYRNGILARVLMMAIVKQPAAIKGLRRKVTRYMWYMRMSCLLEISLGPMFYHSNSQYWREKR